MRHCVATFLMLASIALPAVAQDTITQEGFIAGTMEIDFQTRYKLDPDGAPQDWVKDYYTFNFVVAKTTEFSGKAIRLPQKRSSATVVSGEKEKQPNEIEYSVDLRVVNPNDPTQKKTVGKWVGTVPINDNGEYDLKGTEKNPHRIQIDAVGAAQASNTRFAGRMVGRPRERLQESKGVSFVREVAGRTVKFEVANSDPMRFEGAMLSLGPAQIYPNTTVNGNLDYDYATGNWLTNGIKMSYALNGKDITDTVTGSIKWVEDPARATNGKGRYEFNLRFNEATNKPASTEASAFANMSDEEAFFAVDNTVPTLTGTVEYQDTMVPGRDGTPRVTQSKITYKLNANKLTKQQGVALFKLLLVGIGPFNDE